MPQSLHSITVDKWINEAKYYVVPPAGDGHLPHRSLEYLLWQDKVECILNVTQVVSKIFNFLEFPNYNAFIRRVRDGKIPIHSHLLSIFVFLHPQDSLRTTLPALLWSSINILEN